MYAERSTSDLTLARLVEADITEAILDNTRLDKAQWIDRRRCRTPSVGSCRK